MISYYFPKLITKFIEGKFLSFTALNNDLLYSCRVFIFEDKVYLSAFGNTYRNVDVDTLPATIINNLYYDLVDLISKDKKTNLDAWVKTADNENLITDNTIEGFTIQEIKETQTDYEITSSTLLIADFDSDTKTITVGDLGNYYDSKYSITNNFNVINSNIKSLTSRVDNYSNIENTVSTHDSAISNLNSAVYELGQDYYVVSRALIDQGNIIDVINSNYNILVSGVQDLGNDVTKLSSNYDSMNSSIINLDSKYSDLSSEVSSGLMWRIV